MGASGKNGDPCSPDRSGEHLKAEAAEAADHVKGQIRYATAWFDWELSQLEGAQC